jgi:hypothetical protein
MNAGFVKPRVWTDDEIRADVAAATEAFRTERFAEPLEAWLREVDKRSAEFTRLFEEHDVARPHDLGPEDLPGIVGAKLLDALRYLPGPPISEDDLKSLANVTALSRKRLQDRPDEAARVLEIIRGSVDPRRFPWLAENRDPTDDEKRVAIFSSALLHAAQRLQTDRRNIAKRNQEAAVRTELERVGFTSAKVKTIPAGAWRAFPGTGKFSTGEVMLGGSRSDVVAHLWNDQILAAECKVSNSAVNSNKRLNKDTVAKVTLWKAGFAELIVPAAIIAGVFSPGNVIEAQRGGMFIFWSHRLADLGAFAESTRP